MRLAMQKLFGAGEARAAIAKLNESREAVKIVGSDQDLLRTVEAMPGAVGIVDVYAINSAVKVLRTQVTHRVSSHRDGRVWPRAHRM